MTRIVPTDLTAGTSLGHYNVSSLRRPPGPRIRYNVRAFLILLVSVFDVPIHLVCRIGTPLKTCAIRLLAW